MMSGNDVSQQVDEFKFAFTDECFEWSGENPIKKENLLTTLKQFGQKPNVRTMHRINE